MGGLLDGLMVVMPVSCAHGHGFSLKTRKPRKQGKPGTTTTQQSNHLTIQPPPPISSSRVASTSRPWLFPSDQTASTCRHEAWPSTRVAIHNVRPGESIHLQSIYNPVWAERVVHTPAVQAVRPPLRQRAHSLPLPMLLSRRK
jgi:hypothetical protein